VRVRPHRRAVAAFVVAIAVVAAGCNKSNGNDQVAVATSTTVREKLPAPCSLVTAADAQEFLGGPVMQQPPPTADDAKVTCAYATAGAAKLLLLRETNNVQALPSNDPGVESVDVGEEGYFDSGNPPGTETLSFRRRGVVVSILSSRLRVPLGSAPTSGSDSPLVALGRRVASRL